MGIRTRVSRAWGRTTPAAPRPAPRPAPIDPTVDPIGAADQLEDEGRLVEAMQVLIEANTRTRRPEVERRLVVARHRAYEELSAASGRPDWLPDTPDLTPGVALPEVPRADLSYETVASALVHHGALIVRGVLDDDDVAHLKHVIDETFTRYDAWDQDGVPAEETEPWFWPFEPEGDHKHKHETMARGWVREAGGVSSADSPRGLFDLLEILERADVRDVITSYFGERPAISAKKSVLRRVPTTLFLSDWHQDGAFLGQGIRSLNLWVALTRCGGNTAVPGMDIVPRRMEEVLPTGVEGAIFNWSVSHALVEPFLAEAPIVRPEFGPGDAMLFDEMLIHRTAIPEQPISEERYAIESWFFAPSHYPEKEVPLVF